MRYCHARIWKWVFLLIGGILANMYKFVVFWDFPWFIHAGITIFISLLFYAAYILGKQE